MSTSFLYNYQTHTIAFFLLAATMLSFWVTKNKKVPQILFLFSIVFALIAGVINLVSLAATLLFGLLVYLFYAKETKPIKIILLLAVILLTSLAFLHKIPGYNNWQLDQVQLSQNSSIFKIWFNFDKPLIAIFILFFAYKPITNFKEYKFIILEVIKLFIPLALILSFFGIITNYLVFDLKCPDANIVVLWIVKMTLFTILAEELFFRYFLQNNLLILFEKFKYSKTIALLLASLIFAIFHFPAGISFVLLAFIAGIFYGLIYIRTKSIESSILLHFLVNLSHFIFFSYPTYKVAI